MFILANQTRLHHSNLMIEKFQQDVSALFFPQYHWCSLHHWWLNLYSLQFLANLHYFLENLIFSVTGYLLMGNHSTVLFYMEMNTFLSVNPESGTFENVKKKKKKGVFYTTYHQLTTTLSTDSCCHMELNLYYWTVL